MGLCGRPRSSLKLSLVEQAQSGNLTHAYCNRERVVVAAICLASSVRSGRLALRRSDHRNPGLRAQTFCERGRLTPYFFAFFSSLVLSTSLVTTLIAGFFDLLVGIAAVKLDPTLKGYWLHVD